MKAELEHWDNVKHAMKYPNNDNNKGFVYGINYLDDNGEIIDVTWFTTEEERNKVVAEEKLQLT